MKNQNLVISIFIIACLAVSMVFIWEGHIGFNLWDECYLWYGAQRVILGEVPIRDFMAYDPGRYYWSGAFMNLLNDNGIMTLRISVAIFQTIGLFVGLLLIALVTTKKQNFFYLFLSTIILIAWMYPRHKLFDISLSILLIGSLAFLIENPTRKRYFFTGICTGFVAFFGRNHGIYGIVGTLGVLIWLNIKSLDGPNFIKGGICWAVGVLVGFMPIILMLFFIPGFAKSYWESIIFLFEINATNLPLPIPWPWKVNFTSLSLTRAIHEIFIGLFFVALLIFGILTPLWLMIQKFSNKHVPAAFVAASFLTLPYAHYAYSRADVGHLALGIFPFLIGCLVFLTIQKNRIKWILGGVLCGASLFVIGLFHPGVVYQRSKDSFVNVKISDSDLWVDRGSAMLIDLFHNLSLTYASNNQNFISVPFPGAYSLLEKKSPLWEIYSLFPRSSTFEKTEIERIKSEKPAFVFIFDHPLDGHDELRFRNTHPLIYQYILDNFEPVAHSPKLDYLIFKTKKET